jgi:GNAT superfamily N-acetyltransferase
MTKDGGDRMTRTASARDVPALKALWQTVFGDDAEDIDYFFDVYFSPGLTAVIGAPEAPAAAAYALPVGDLILPDGEIVLRDAMRVPCAMIYAVATHPEFRGRGYGAAVSRAAERLAVGAGFPAAVLKPADAGLFDFYEKHTDFRPFFGAYEFKLTRDQLTPAPAWTPSPVSPGEYRRLRNRFLAGLAYIDADERALGYQQHLSALAGGGLYALLEGGNAVGCAIAEKGGGAIAEKGGNDVVIKELLAADGCRLLDAVSALASLLDSRRYLVRTPTPSEEAHGAPVPFGMLLPVAGLERCRSAQSATWYGPAFD